MYGSNGNENQMILLLKRFYIVVILYAFAIFSYWYDTLLMWYSYQTSFILDYIWI